MTRTPYIAALAAAALLAGCNKENHTIVAGGGPADEPANATANAPVELPPTISSTKIYRCADNNLIYVDWLSDNKSANIRTDRNGSPTHVIASETGQPMVAAGGFELSGTTGASSAKIAVPGHPSQTCKA